MKYVVSIVLLFVTCKLLLAQDISVTADYQPVVREGEQFTITWNINAAPDDFNPPPFTGFYKLMGPQIGSMSSTVLNNGRLSRQTQYSYTYYFQAIKQGKYSLAPATVKVKNKIYSSDSIRIEVIGGNQPATSKGAGNAEAEDKEAGNVAARSSDMFLRIIPSATEVYAGQPFSVTSKFYTRIQITDLSEIKFPAFNSFIKEDIGIPPLTSLKREVLNGITYGTGIKSQLILIPQVVGSHTLEPFEITAMVQQRSGQSDPFFGDFFSTYSNVPQVVASDPVTIKVKPLPLPKPDDFSGIVGNISMAASLNKDSVFVNDAINLKIVISGSGNLKLAGAPTIKVAGTVEVFDPKITDNFTFSTEGVSGQKVFEFVLIPREPGRYTIPSVSYNFFNPVKGKYETLSSGERFFIATGAGGGSDLPVFSGVSGTDVKFFGKDIRYVVTEPRNQAKKGKPLINSYLFLSWYGISLAAFILIILARREHLRRNSDLRIIKNRKAGRIATKRLREAEKCLKEGIIEKFYEEILKALWGYLSDKLSIPLSELTRENASNTLRDRGIPEVEISKLMEILEACEFARFAPAGSGSETSAIYSGASDFINNIENTIRKNI